MFCTRCGLRLEDGANFCRSCGQSASAPGVPAQTAVPGVAPPLPLHYAGFWRRFAAYLIDGLILGIPFYLLLGGMIVRMRRRFGPLEGPGTLVSAPAAGPGDLFHSQPGLLFAAIIGRLLILGAIFFVIHWLYFAGMEASERQATLGKSALSIYVTDLEARPLSFGHASGRFFSRIITGLIPFGIGFILAGFTARKQALHDMIAGTLVLRR